MVVSVCGFAFELAFEAGADDFLGGGIVDQNCEFGRVCNVD